MKAQHFSETVAVCRPDQHCDLVPLTPDLYQILDDRYEQFRGHSLVALHNFSKDWPTWEIHPNGDELVCLMSGEAEFLLKTATGIESVVLSSPGSYVLVPKNTWHTARVAQAASCLFITPGEGTRNEINPGA